MTRVERDAPFTHVEVQEEGARLRRLHARQAGTESPGTVAVWSRFDLDYVRAEGGEHTSAEWPGDAFGDLDYPYALEGECGHGSLNHLSLYGLTDLVSVPFTLTPALSLRERGTVD